MKKEQLEEDFLKVNPNHKVPTLVDGDFLLEESTAIMLYLTEKHGGNELLPESLKKRMKMHQWMAWHISHFGPICTTLIHENLVKSLVGLGSPDPEQVASAEENFHNSAQRLNNHLQSNRWLAGDTSSLADHTVASHFAYAKAARFPLRDYDNVNRWCEEMLGMEAWRAALKNNPFL